MRFLLDTNVCIAYLNGTDRAVKRRLLSLTPDQACLCSVVKAELLYGARRSTHVERNLGHLLGFFDSFDSLPFDDGAAVQYGVLRARLEREGGPVGANDMMIASIALACDLTLVTRDQREFARVIGLRLESW